ncbi:DUF1302 family protein [Zoogloeaceae bacterium G21618-S1]|nr:DUF1302 family protein [Zoogloeaceae bacterium G21618-S1]
MKTRIVATSAMAAACLSGTGTALAADWSASGFIRQEVAVKTSGDSNINNQQGNTYNGVTVANTGLFGGNITRPDSHTKDNTFNLFQTRFELNVDGRLSDNWSAHFKLRGIADEIGRVEDAFDNRNTFEQEFYATTKATPLEANGKDWMLDLPVAYADYSSGPLWLRFGNQQIAWGEALFFRVADVPNGLDLRRHSVLGVAAEEYSDSRVPSLGIRGSYRVTDDWEVEGFAQKFQASVVPGANSPYNPIPAQFTIQERPGFDDARNKWNFGARLKGKVGDFDVHAFAVRRNNPDGVYKWTLANGAGTLAGSAFQGGTNTGVFSAAEWYSYAAATRLDGLGALETALNEFPGTVGLGANAVAAGCGAPSSAVGAIRVDKASGGCILDTFFTTGSLRGHLVREFPRETVLGFGINHVFEGEPDSLMDQLIGRFELSYTPNKKFTNPTLSRHYIENDETQFAFIAEKYHKFSNSVPATYMVAQWLHKSASDLFGRSLVGVNNVAGERPNGQSGGFNAVAFALQQPSPTLAWRFDMTVLTDLKGGWLFQPGVKWKPNQDFQLDVYANVLKSYGAQDNRNFAQGLEYANEVFARATISF